jgi:hypothetical protein
MIIGLTCSSITNTHRSTRSKVYASQAKIAALFCLALALPLAFAKDVSPMRQGVHEWSSPSGKLILVVGSYQDTVQFRRSYSFYFQAKGDDTWNQVPIMGNADGMQFSWNSAHGADVTLADGVVVQRKEGTYFIVASKRSDKGYHDTGTATATWYKFVEADGSNPDVPAYALQPVFTRAYPMVKEGIEPVLTKETTLKPAR